jgi:hypothetical protein
MNEAECGDRTDVLEKSVETLAAFLAELGACPPMKTACPQRGQAISIRICSDCLKVWAAEKS